MNCVIQVLVLIILLCCQEENVVRAARVKATPPRSQQQNEEKQQAREQTGAAAAAAAAADSSKCRWGEPCYNKDNNKEENNSRSNESTASASQQQQHQQHQPSATNLPAFVTSKSGGKQQQQHAPPEAYSVDARVYTDPHDKLAHFDDDDVQQLAFFSDCASTGITTAPLRLKHAYFRHSVVTDPQHYEGGVEQSEFLEDAHHAVMLVTLHESIIVELNSGEVQTFSPGSVILFEDVVAGGHKVKSAAAGGDVTVLLLTLPHHATSLSSSRRRRASCLLQPQHTPHLRRSILTGMGAALSLLLADWLGKVAPIWLSIGIGGGCLVVGGTVGFVKSGESLLDQVELYREKQRLNVLGNGSDNSDGDEDAGYDQ